MESLGSRGASGTGRPPGAAGSTGGRPAGSGGVGLAFVAQADPEASASVDQRSRMPALADEVARHLTVVIPRVPRTGIRGHGIDGETREPSFKSGEVWCSAARTGLGRVLALHRGTATAMWYGRGLTTVIAHQVWHRSQAHASMRVCSWSRGSPHPIGTPGTSPPGRPPARTRSLEAPKSGAVNLRAFGAPPNGLAQAHG